MIKTFTNKQIVEIINVLLNDISFVKNKEIKTDFKILWAVKRNLKTFTDIFETIKQMQNEIIQRNLKMEYFKTNENGQSVIKDEYKYCIDTANNEINDLLSQTNDVDIFTFDEETLQNFIMKNNEKISMPEFSALEFFIANDK